MAKKRQTSKATDKGDAETAKPDDLEKIIPDTTESPETDAAGKDETPAPEDDEVRSGDVIEPTEVLEPEAEEKAADAEEAETVAAVETDTEDQVGKTGEHVAETDAGEKSEDKEDTGDFVLIDAQTDASDSSDTDKPGEQPEEAEPVTEAVAIIPAPQPKTEIVRGSIWPGFFGGVIAALIGFIVGRGDALDAYLPAALQRPAADMSALEAEAAALAARTDELLALTEAQEARIAALETAEAPDSSAGVAALEQEIARLTERLSEMESRPAETVTVDDTAAQEALDAIAALETVLQAQTAELEALSQRAAEAEERAAGEAARILARAALMRVQVAVDSGESFSPALNELEEVTPVDVPVVLRDAAETGVPTLAALQSSFPDAARAGLAAARADVPESDVNGLTGFFQRQLNIRSLSPREGTDPDAVLSRAQAAVRTGDLGTALSEMEALPEAARAAMQDWLEAASARKAAQDAANELADSLNSN